MGILAVEMECFALYCNAARAGVQALGIFSVSDNLATGQELSAQQRQEGFTSMMEVALETARRLGLTDAVLSFELNLARARDVRRAVPRGVIAYGRLPLMVTRACPLDGKCASCSGSRQLVDRKGVRFPVVCHGEYMEILNSAPLYLADKLADLQGLDFALLSFTLESPAQCREIFQEYEAGTSAPRENITRGLCYRNVL